MKYYLETQRGIIGYEPSLAPIYLNETLWNSYLGFDFLNSHPYIKCAISLSDARSVYFTHKFTITKIRSVNDKPTHSN